MNKDSVDMFVHFFSHCLNANLTPPCVLHHYTHSSIYPPTYSFIFSFICGFTRMHFESVVHALFHLFGLEDSSINFSLNDQLVIDLLADSFIHVYICRNFGLLLIIFRFSTDGTQIPLQTMCSRILIMGLYGVRL